MGKTLKYIITIVLVALMVTAFVLFEAVHIDIIVTDYEANRLLCSIIYHLVVGALLLWLIYIVGRDNHYPS